MAGWEVAREVEPRGLVAWAMARQAQARWGTVALVMAMAAVARLVGTEV